MNAAAAPIVRSAVSSSEVRPPFAAPGVHYEVQQFLIQEALLLDNMRLREWTALLAEDLVYKAPVRQTRSRSSYASEFSATTGHFHDDYLSILERVSRLVDLTSAWAEDPPSRTRRFVSNISVFDTSTPNEYEVISYLMLTRNRFDQETYQLLTAERHDRVRRVGNGFKLARRDILIDQAVLGMPNLAVFL